MACGVARLQTDSGERCQKDEALSPLRGGTLRAVTLTKGFGGSASTQRFLLLFHQVNGVSAWQRQGEGVFHMGTVQLSAVRRGGGQQQLTNREVRQAGLQVVPGLHFTRQTSDPPALALKMPGGGM